MKPTLQGKGDFFELRKLLGELLGNTRPELTAELVARLDALVPELQSKDARLAHFLERRSYHKALEYLSGA